MQILYITFEMFKPFGLHASKVFFIFLIIWFSNLSTLRVPDEGYSSNVPDEGYSRKGRAH